MEDLRYSTYCSFTKRDDARWQRRTTIPRYTVQATATLASVHGCEWLTNAREHWYGYRYSLMSPVTDFRCSRQPVITTV